MKLWKKVLLLDLIIDRRELMTKLAEITDLDKVLQITHVTISEIYSHSEYQFRGYGSQLMDFAEDKIAKQFTHVYIDSSLAAKEMYLKRGYQQKKTSRIPADNGDILVCDEMENGLISSGTYKTVWDSLCKRVFYKASDLI